MKDTKEYIRDVYRSVQSGSERDIVNSVRRMGPERLFRNLDMLPDLRDYQRQIGLGPLKNSSVRKAEASANIDKVDKVFRRRDLIDIKKAIGANPTRFGEYGNRIGEALRYYRMNQYDMAAFINDSNRWPDVSKIPETVRGKRHKGLRNVFGRILGKDEPVSFSKFREFFGLPGKPPSPPPAPAPFEYNYSKPDIPMSKPRGGAYGVNQSRSRGTFRISEVQGQMILEKARPSIPSSWSFPKTFPQVQPASDSLPGWKSSLFDDYQTRMSGFEKAGPSRMAGFRKVTGEPELPYNKYYSGFDPFEALPQMNKDLDSLLNRMERSRDPGIHKIGRYGKKAKSWLGGSGKDRLISEGKEIFDVYRPDKALKAFEKFSFRDAAKGDGLIGFASQKASYVKDTFKEAASETWSSTKQVASNVRSGTRIFANDMKEVGGQVGWMLNDAIEERIGNRVRRQQEAIVKRSNRTPMKDILLGRGASPEGKFQESIYRLMDPEPKMKFFADVGESMSRGGSKIREFSRDWSKQGGAKAVGALALFPVEAALTIGGAVLESNTFQKGVGGYLEMSRGHNLRLAQMFSREAVEEGGRAAAKAGKGSIIKTLAKGVGKGAAMAARHPVLVAASALAYGLGSSILDSVDNTDPRGETGLAMKSIGGFTGLMGLSALSARDRTNDLRGADLSASVNPENNPQGPMSFRGGTSSMAGGSNYRMGVTGELGFALHNMRRA